MAFDTTAASSILKEFYGPALKEQLNQATPLLAELDKDSDHVEGKRLVIPVHVGRSEAVGARSENGLLPTAQSQRYKEAIVNPKYEYGRIELTLPVIKAAASDKGSFVRAVESETKGMLSETKEDIDRQLASNDELGRGALASATAAGPVNDIPVADEFGTQFKLRKNMVIDIVNTTNDAELAASRSITAVAYRANGNVNTVTIGGAAVTVTTDHRLVREDAWKQELIGIPGIVKETGTLHGIDPTVEGEWKASVSGNAGTPRAITDDVLQAGNDLAWAKTGEDGTFLIVSNIFQRRKYAASLISQKRYVNTLDLKGGFKTITWNDQSPFILDKYFPNDRVAMLNRKHIKLYELADWDWMDQDGAVLSRVANKAAYEATLFKYAELGTDRRNAHVMVTDLSVS